MARVVDNGHAVECSSIVAMEKVDARREVVEYAEELHREQLETHLHLKRTGQRTKSRPPTADECRAKSREIRIKRERDATHRNDSTNPYA
jgi:hypothetical protein